MNSYEILPMNIFDNEENITLVKLYCITSLIYKDST